MVAVSPSYRIPTGLAPYFRRYELPWSPAEDMERRFRLILRSLFVVVAILALILAFLPRHPTPTNTQSLPERVVQLAMEVPPPPPPPPPQPIKPVEKTSPSLKPTPLVKQQDPKVKAAKSGLLASMDDLAALRATVDVDTFSKNQSNSDAGDVNVVQRNTITSSKVGGSSGGINAPTSSGLAAGAGSLHGIHTTQVSGPALASAQPATRTGGSGRATRGGEEIALVFTKNKGAIDALYARALRDSPALQGKVVIEMTIAPSGEITAARIVSSELNDPEFEAKLLARVRLFRFEAKDVGALTATKPIDFFPVG